MRYVRSCRCDNDRREMYRPNKLLGPKKLLSFKGLSTGSGYREPLHIKRLMSQEDHMVRLSDISLGQSISWRVRSALSGWIHNSKQRVTYRVECNCMARHLGLRIDWELPSLSGQLVRVGPALLCCRAVDAQVQPALASRRRPGLGLQHRFGAGRSSVLVDAEGLHKQKIVIMAINVGLYRNIIISPLAQRNQRAGNEAPANRKRVSKRPK
jgi:hypothetical protein